MLATLAAFAVSFGILYMASTTNMARRKKRQDSPTTYFGQLADILWQGLFCIFRGKGIVQCDYHFRLISVFLMKP